MKTVSKNHELESFLDASAGNQLAFIAALSHRELLGLNNRYKRSIGNRALRPVEYPVFERMLQLLYPGEHVEYDQDAELRLRLTPEALARVRSETYRSEISGLLHASIAAQVKFIGSLSLDQLKELIELLDRYARERGRSNRVRQLEAQVKQQIYNKG